MSKPASEFTEVQARQVTVTIASAAVSAKNMQLECFSFKLNFVCALAISTGIHCKFAHIFQLDVVSVLHHDDSAGFQITGTTATRN
jgi:hypothetical protein